ncbi:MAG TPA: hypothetical protein VI455_10740 [Terriglobia bacterium]
MKSSLALMGVLTSALAMAGQSSTPAPTPATPAPVAAVSAAPASAPVAPAGSTNAAASTPATPASTAGAPPPSTVAGQLVVPVNTTIPLSLSNTLNSRTAYAGQAIYCVTIYPIAVNNRIVLPVGTYVKGKITQVTRPGRVKGKAEMGLRFDEITLPNGVTKPLRAILSGFGGSGNEGFNPKEGKIQGESSKGKDAEVIAISGGEGAAIGSVAGISSGHSGVGAGVGGAAGAVGGLVYVLATRGKEVVLPQGTNLELELAAPLTYYADELESPSSGPAGPALGRRDPGPGL